MVKKFVLLGCLLLSVNVMFSQNITDQACYNLKLVYPELKNQIIAYQDEINTPSVDDKFVIVYCKNIDEKTEEFRLLYCMDINRIIVDAPQAFHTVNDKLVGFVLEDINFFSLSDSCILSLMQEHFPGDYEYFKKFKVYPPPITAQDVIWKLKFRDGKLIEKTISED